MWNVIEHSPLVLQQRSISNKQQNYKKYTVLHGNSTVELHDLRTQPQPQHWTPQTLKEQKTFATSD